MFTKLIVLALLLLGACWAWARFARRQRLRFIGNTPLPHSLRAALVREQPSWGPAELGAVERGLRQYFRLCALQSGSFIAMPSKAVDLAWHAFILDTHAYQRWCRNAFGRFLHHRPAEALPPAEAAPRLQAGLRRAWWGACRDEGLNPRQPARLPLLFALDAELGIEGGYRYVADCRLLGVDRGDTHCAAALACGGSGGSDGHSASSSNDNGGSDGGGGD